MRTLPDSPTCPTHGDDLKSLVEQELATDPVLGDSAWLGPGHGKKGLRPFLVIVQCPGGGGHEQEVEGSWSP